MSGSPFGQIHVVLFALAALVVIAAAFVAAVLFFSPGLVF